MEGITYANQWLVGSDGLLLYLPPTTHTPPRSTPAAMPFTLPHHTLPFLVR